VEKRFWRYSYCSFLLSKLDSQPTTKTGKHIKSRPIKCHQKLHGCFQHIKSLRLRFFLLHLQQDGSAQGDDTSSTGQHDLAGTSSDDSRLGRGVGSSALGVGSGGVVVGGGGARDGGRGGDGLGDRAGAVQDGQGGGRGDGVGLAVVSQESGLRAVCGQSRDDLGRVGNVAGRDGGGKGQDGSNRELHFDDWTDLSRRRVRDKE